MDEKAIHEHAGLLAGDLMNALSDLECLWAYHGLPGVLKEHYGRWPEWLVKVVGAVVVQQDTGSLMQAERMIVDELYRRFNNPNMEIRV
jgi:hypothetical protein